MTTHGVPDARAVGLGRWGDGDEESRDSDGEQDRTAATRDVITVTT